MGNLREIKFRVWDSISKAFHYWGNIQNNKFSDFDLEHYTLMQYTGSKDKNGIDIYEGDVCKYKNYKGVVSYVGRGYECKANNHNGLDMLRYREELIEVIGNIYQNHELL